MEEPIGIEEEVEVEIRAKYAGFWIRLCAHLVDSFIVLIIGYLVGIVLGVFFATSGLQDVLAPIAGFLGVIVRWAYYVYMTYDYEATLGKKLFGLRVISNSNEQVDLGQVFLRETVGKIASAVIFGIGFLMIGFNDKKEGLHDKIGKTRVVYGNSTGPEKWQVFSGGIVMLIAAGVFSSFVLYLMTSAASNVSQYKASSFYAHSVLIQLSEDVKSCIEGGGSIVQPEARNGKGALCSNDSTVVWPELGNNSSYGLISNESIEIVLDNGEIFGCRIDDENCGFVGR